YSNQGGRPSAAVRQGRYKLIRFFEDEHCELYDLEQDVGEQHDLAAALPEVVEELRDALARHLREVGALIPQRNPWPEPFGCGAAAAQFRVAMRCTRASPTSIASPTSMRSRRQRRCPWGARSAFASPSSSR